MLSEIEKKIRNKQEICIKHFNKMYTEDEREHKTDLLNDVLYQIEVCEDLCKPVTETQIQDWLRSRSVSHLAVKAKTHKFA